MFFLLSHREAWSAPSAPALACVIGQKVGGRSYLVLSDRTPSVLGNGPEVQA